MGSHGGHRYLWRPSGGGLLMDQPRTQWHMVSQVNHHNHPDDAGLPAVIRGYWKEQMKSLGQLLYVNFFLD